jgi:diketogulonate reductase-like aldo/keto reductase
MAKVTDIGQMVPLANGVEMPWFGLGTWKARGDEAAAAVRTALELGYRLIDTASIYENEDGVGRGLRESDVPREEIFVTSKVWNDDQGYDEALRAFDASTQRLGLETLDLYLVHWAVRGKYKETWRALERLYREGRVRAIGVSNFLVHHLDDLLADCEIVPMVNQVEFHPHLVQPELLAYCRDRRIQLEAWSPLMRGEALGLPEVEAIGRKYGKSPAQVVLRWDLEHDVITIPKSSRREHLAANADIFDFELTPEDIAAIDALDQNRRVGPDPDVFPNE